MVLRSVIVLVVLAATAIRATPTQEPTLVSHAPARLDLGRLTSTVELAAWDIDVNGRGVGLPPGRGTAAVGAQLYAQKCAACHGSAGEGTAAGSQLIPPKAGGVRPRRNVATHWPFAPPLFDYIRRTMPPSRPGSLPDDEVYSLVAFMLLQSGIDPSDVQDADSLARVKMPSRDRFVPDDRRGGREVK